MDEDRIEDVLVKIDQAMRLLHISRTSAWKLAQGEWLQAGISTKVGGAWRIHWPRLLKHYGLNGQ
jgi:hypothetical protein